jgi:carboxyl-terminal processing protease
MLERITNFVFQTSCANALLLVSGAVLAVALILLFLFVKFFFRKQPAEHYVISAIFCAAAVLGGVFFGMFAGFNYVPTAKTNGAFKSEVFWEMWDTTARNSLEKPSQHEMFIGVLKGMASATNDKHTAYLTPAENAESEEYSPGKEVADKIEYMVAPEGLEIISLFFDSPAYEAGLRDDDVILSIDNCAWFELSDKIREPGEHKFRVLKFRTNEEVEMKFAVETKIKIKGVRWWVRSEIAYMQITSFNGDAAEEFGKAVPETLKQKPKGLILDLRGNRGGDLETMLKIADAWIPGKIVQVRKSPDGETINDYSIKSKVSGKFKTLTTVVLMDKNTASASEGLVAGLKYHTGARFVGERTYGKCVTQEITRFPDGSKYYLVKWEWTNRGGIKYDKGIGPDIETSSADAFDRAWKLLRD